MHPKTRAKNVGFDSSDLYTFNVGKVSFSSGCDEEFRISFVITFFYQIRLGENVNIFYGIIDSWF